jgi:hypothetical protein
VTGPQVDGPGEPGDARIVFDAVVNSTDADDGIDAAESHRFQTLPSAERWINRRVDRFLGASIYEIEVRTVGGRQTEREVSQRVYTHDFSGQWFVLDEIVESKS